MSTWIIAINSARWKKFRPRRESTWMSPTRYSFFSDSSYFRALMNHREPSPRTGVVVYASRSGTAKRVAGCISRMCGFTDCWSISDKSFDEILRAGRIFLVIASDGEGLPVPSGVLFYKLLQDLVQDFRVSRDHLSSIEVCVVGVGSVEYGMADFCTAARTMHSWFSQLGAKCVSPPILVSDTEEIESQSENCSRLISSGVSRDKARHILAWKGLEINSNSESDEDDSSSVNSYAVEDVGDESCGKEMLTDRQRKQLEKEGYQIIGSHSAVKLCRWTKHHSRGRGGCYKHTFYGISSMNCMEATPSLACANKCVFCWRHHKNPVGTSWKWKTDPADEIVQSALELHRNLIKQLKGVPGVTEANHASAMNVKHCALSLVGEPIMYPQINELISELHKRRISTFLVTNAQFPEAIKTLSPVTQLYVSVDAATPEALKRTDRPLFGDYWERYIDSFKAIAKKTQRTVYRLTLVKEYNMAEDEDIIGKYCDLVKLGNPDFIEIKAVTFCGAGDSADSLTMKNVPWHEEVVKFSTALCNNLSDNSYEIACEHKHSCSVLIALRKYKLDGVWHTWIDYERFADLALSGRSDFTPEQYWAPTPDWAVFGAEERGFDPEQLRHQHRSSKALKTVTVVSNT